jgi:hypothetical protein
MSDGVISRYTKREGAKDSARAESPAGGTAGGKKPYEAHAGKDRQLYLKLHPYKHRSAAVQYSHLFLYEYDDEIFETLVLEFGFMEALIRGKNLSPIVSSLSNHTCEFIREFHPEVHEHPGAGEPIVTQMTLRLSPAGGASEPKPEAEA